MKRFLIGALLCCTISYMPAQTGEDSSLDPKQVPAVVVQNFTQQYPNVAAAWHKDGSNFRVNYIDPQSKLGRIMVYDKEGNVVRSENEVDATGYPSTIGDYYSENYPGETYQVWTTDDKTGGRTLYFSNRNDETIWFDNKGKVLPAKKASKVVKKNPKKK